MARGKNKKAAAANKPKGRPGPKSKFKGFRLQYMESILPTYLQHVSKGTTPSYWAVATAGYWARFNWRNSDLGVEVDEETFNNASVRPDVDGELSAEDEEKKSHIMATTNKQIRNWLQNHKNKTSHSKVWEPLLNHLNQSTIVPRKPNISQFVMGHDDYKEAVDAEFDEQMEETDTPANEQMALRCKIAKDLFDAEDAETQQRLRQENNDQHNTLVVAAEQAASQPLPTLSSGDKQSARDTMPSIVQPVLNGLEDHTDMTYILIGVRPPPKVGSQFEVLALQSNGRARAIRERPTFFEHDEECKARVLAALMRYEQETGTPSIPTPGPSTSSSPAPTDLLSFDDEAASNTSPPPSASRTTTPLPSAPREWTTLPPTPLAPASVPLPQPAPRPAPRPAFRQIASTAPTPASAPLASSVPQTSFMLEPQSLSLPDDLLPFPYLSRHIASLPPNEQKDELARVMQLSEHGRIQDDKGHEIDHLLNANPFLDNFDTVDYEILAQTMCINPLPNLLIQQENEVGISRELVEATEKTPASGCFDGDTPTKSQPSRAARIALKRAFHTEASCSPPRAPLTTTSAVLPPSIEHLSLPNTSANSANTASYTLPPHPIQKCSSAPEPTTSASTAVVPLTAAEMTKFPDWLNSWYLRFSKLPYSQAWLKLVNQWTALEKGYGFKSPAKPLSRRLDLVCTWAKSKFSPDHEPDPMPVRQIAEKFWCWWAHLNAPARSSSTSDGRFAPGPDGGNIAIENLRVPGKNGWLGLLYTLMVWRRWVGEDTADWETAVVDVLWVTRRLCESTYYNASAEMIPTLKRSLDVGSDNVPTKRIRKAPSYRA